MERKEATRQLERLVGYDLHELAPTYGVTVVSSNGMVNKGWAGHVCERYLGLPINSAQSPNFGSWELKSISIQRKKNGELGIKETMAITMIDPYNVVNTPFEESHLLSKLEKAVIVVKLVGRSFDYPQIVHSIVTLDLNGELYFAVRDDYEMIRDCIRDPARGFHFLSGKMGRYIQPRTKGTGHGSTSRAFYARKQFLEQFIDL